MEGSCTSGSNVQPFSCSGGASTGYLADQVARTCEELKRVE
jgi:uncharacterized metal-binding protein